MKFYDKSISNIYENGRKMTLTSLATPIFLELVSTGLLGMINTLLLSGYSQDAVGATGVVTQLISLMTTLLYITIWGMRIILGVEFGRGNKKEIADAEGTALWMMLVSSLILGIVAMVFTEPLLDIMNLEGNPKAIVIGFAKISFATMVVTGLKGFFTVSLTCNGYTKYSSLSVVVTQILNIVTGWFILYGNMNLPFGKLEGLAIRSVLSQLIGMAIVVVVIIAKKCPFSLRFRTELMKKILRLGVPAAANGIGYTFSQTVTTSVIAGFGIDVINAKIYVSNITSYVCYFSGSISQASAIIMGRLRGREEFEKENLFFWQNVRLAMIINLVVSIAIFVARVPILKMFTTSAEIIKIASIALFLDVFVELVRGATNIGDQNLVANGDVKIVSAASVSASLGISLLVWLLGAKLGFGIVGCWVAFIIEEVYKSSIYLVRWKSGKWKNAKV